MRILLTNDDGFFAPGITALYKELSLRNKHEIFIVAPEGQRSATGRAITIYQPLFVAKRFLNNKNIGYSVEGTPTDCVKLAIQGKIMPFKPDLLISGINNGPNLGTDIFYSGTVSAAMEGVLLGIPSLAVSLASYECVDYGPSARFINSFIENNYALDNNGLLNINIPATKENEWKEIKITKLGKTVYLNTFEKRKTPYNKEYYWISGSLSYEDDVDTDLRAVKDGFVSITPLHGDLTDYKRISKLSKVKW